MSTDLRHGDALDVFRNVRGLASITADLPGGGHFMNLAFDHSHGGRDRWIRYWAERLRVAREATERGAYGLFWAFGRTAHWTACSIDDAGWEIVRPILHIHGQGWTKSNKSQLKPAQEIWWLCRWGGVTPLQIDRCRVRRSWAERSASWFRSGHSAKPIAAKIGGAPAGNGIHVHPDGSWPTDLLLSHCPACREVGTRVVRDADYADGTAWECLAACSCGLASLSFTGGAPSPCSGCGDERWWACPVAEMDGQSGLTKSGWRAEGVRKSLGYGGGNGDGGPAIEGDEGGASRFYPTFHYDAKASKRERQSGCEGLLWVRDDSAPIGWRRVTAEEYGRTPLGSPKKPEKAEGNVHATIKPIGAGAADGLMRWLVRLITPSGGRGGDISMGSGGTCIAYDLEGHNSIGCDIDAGAVEIARARAAFWTPERHRQVLADDTALKNHEMAIARERALKKGLHHEDLPLWDRKTVDAFTGE